MIKYFFTLMGVGICKAQDIFTRHSIHENFRNIVQNADSFYLLNADTSNDGAFKMYQRWKYFWTTRIDSGTENFKGYVQKILNYNNNNIIDTSALLPWMYLISVYQSNTMIHQLKFIKI